jgi:hypothetical protein
MACSSCGNGIYNPNSSCSSCGGDCGAPKKIITKQGLQGEQGEQGSDANDRFGYKATSNDTIDIDDLYTNTNTINLTIEPFKAFQSGDVVRVSDSPDLNFVTSETYVGGPTMYFQTIVSSYNPFTGELILQSVYEAYTGAVIGFEPLKKIVGTGSYDTWYISLVDPKIDSIASQSNMVYSATKSFNDNATTYLQTTSDDILNPAEIGVNKLTFDPLDPDVYVYKNMKNSHFNADDAANGNFRGLNVKAVEIELFLTAPTTAIDDYWITPINVSGTDIYEPGSISIVRSPDYSVYGGGQFIQDGYEFYTMGSFPVGRGSKNVSLKATHHRFFKGNGIAGGNGGEIYHFKVLNNTNRPIVGKDLLTPGASTLYGYYAIRVYI